MDAADVLRAALDRSVPEATANGLQVCRSRSGKLALCGRLDASLATRVNISAARACDELGLARGAISRRELELVLPQVRLGDVTTQEERQVLAQHTRDEAYLDPESVVDAPAWNSDFVAASDRRHRKHLKPRYAPDDDATVDAVAAFIAEHCRNGHGIVVHTGAGISAAAGIATYREGSSSSIAMSAALPTYAHYALVALTRRGLVDYVVSQNVDGLHRRSGLAADRLSELHGNSYIETCSCCMPPMEFVRPYDAYNTPANPPIFFAWHAEAADGSKRLEANVPLTANERSSGLSHLTGRACPRGHGPLRDSVIHFSESLPVRALQEAERRSRAAPLNMVIGSSLLVSPANGLPFEGNAPVAIVAMTCTGADLRALKRGGVLLRGPADAAVERIMHHLGMAHWRNAPGLMDTLHARVRGRDEAVLRSNGDVPYDGGADGGVVPDSLLSPPPTAGDSGGTGSRAGIATSAGAVGVAAGAPPPTPALRLRQTHERVADGTHRWSLCLENAEQDQDKVPLTHIKAVRYELHPTFTPSSFEVKSPPFAVGPFIGWGTFDVRVAVDLGRGRSAIATTFPLSFERAETTMALAIPA